jgi:branched-chain amino acid aminotransferase
MLNPAGIVTEASNSNVFFVIDGQLVTPSFESGILRGITKAAIQRICAEQRLPVHEKRIPASDLIRASECFVTSATREVMPVAALRLENGQWREFPPGGDELTRQVAQAYKEYVARYAEEHASLRLL